MLKLPYSDRRELAMDILRYGGDVEELGPPELREMLKEQIEAAAKHYD